MTQIYLWKQNNLMGGAEQVVAADATSLLSPVDESAIIVFDPSSIA